jgi:hypothetical protein
MRASRSRVGDDERERRHQPGEPTPGLLAPDRVAAQLLRASRTMNSSTVGRARSQTLGGAS